MKVLIIKEPYATLIANGNCIIKKDIGKPTFKFTDFLHFILPFT